MVDGDGIAGALDDRPEPCPALSAEEFQSCRTPSGRPAEREHTVLVDELGEILDRFLEYGETTTSLINASPIPRRDPPVPEG